MMALLRKFFPHTLLSLVLFFIGFGTSQLFSSLTKTKQSGVQVIPTPLASPSAVLGSTKELTQVKRVIDGDTIELTDGKRVRYIGIDTPETVDPRKPVQCFGREAHDKNAELLSGKEVRLEKDISETDKYGRLLRYVYVNDVMVNDTLVREGFAHASSYPPDIKYQEQLTQAEAEARQQERGLWSSCESGQSPSVIHASTPPSSAQKTSLPDASCLIKGNISSSGKIYHLPGCGSYDKTSIDESVGERWFCTEEEAIFAGWRKAKNCP